ncbi:MAG: IclR family pca regulon transcriptional regulator [Ascidiaceihabitans sp.]|jgi:IclR family pca regulon transcriptional regulator
MTNKDNASTFSKGLSVLSCFETGRQDLTMAEVSRLTGFDRATTRRLCLTLEDTGYLHKTDRTFRLSPKILAVAGGYLTSNDFGRSVQPVLNQFAEEFEGEIALAMRDGNRAIYVARSAISSARVSFGFTIGSTLPLLPTAVGRMLLACNLGDELDAALSRLTPEKFTEATELNPTAIRAKIEQSADQGYAFVRNEFEMGAAGIAVPIGKIGMSSAVLATTASINQFDKAAEFDRALDVLRRAAMSLRF